MFPDTIIKRPAPIVWRTLLGIFLCYSTFMTFVLLLPRDSARWMFKLFHPSFGNPLPDKNYADDCRVFTPENPVSGMFNIYDAVFDVHFVAHLAGWWFKMMIIRDTKIAWVISGTFELIEVSFRHWLENFWECWWDHLFLDLFGCNMFGILLGALTIKYIGVSRINWVYSKPQRQPGTCENDVVSRTLSKLKPEVYTTYSWNIFSNLTRYMQVCFYVFFVLSVDTLNFFLKYVLWVSHESDLLKVRVAIWGFTAIVTSKEYFEYINDPNSNRVGPFFWLSTYTLFIEYSIWFKFSRGLFDAPFPWYVKLIHVTYFSAVTFGAIYAYNNGLASEKQKQSNKVKYDILDPDMTIENTNKVL